MRRIAPFTPTEIAELSNALRAAPTTIDELERLRARVSGHRVRLDAIRALVGAEPGLAATLFARIVPSILHHARTLLTTPDPTLTPHEQGVSAQTTLPRTEVAGWIAHMFLGTVPRVAHGGPHVDFAPLLSVEWPSETAKLRCVLAYFDRIRDVPPRGRLSVERIALPARAATQWIDDDSPLLPIHLDERGVIEDAAGHRQVDFANRYLGGGVLSGGCVQEEIRFAVSPELLAGMLVSPVMRDDEAIILRGAEQFARTSGYARSLRYGGPFDDPCGRDLDGTPRIELVAIDAINYHHVDPGEQFTEAAVLRELAKARCGFHRDQSNLPVATGNWGCGAFAGDPPLKAVIQWLAASAEGRALRYYSFGDVRVGDLAGFSQRAQLRFVTVGALARRLLSVLRPRPRRLYDELLAE